MNYVFEDMLGHFISRHRDDCNWRFAMQKLNSSQDAPVSHDKMLVLVHHHGFWLMK